jgi:uncharacterized protein YdcH (DUF465 family)
MSEINHSLYNDFPKYRERINQLKLENEEFARMAAEYHKIDHQVRGLEMNDIPVADHTFEELKYKRLNLKDKLYRMLQPE